MPKIKSIPIKSIAVVYTAFYLFFGITIPAFAQTIDRTYTFKHYTIHEGLAQMQVMSLFQDSRGYLWCSTKAGISRFDGSHFVNFPNALITQGHDIITLGESEKGNLLLFGTHEFAELREDSLTYFNYPDSTSSSSLLQLSHALKMREVHSTATSSKKESIYAMDYSDPDNLKTYKVSSSRGKIIFLDNQEDTVVWQSDMDSIYVSDLISGTLLRSFPNPNHINQLFRNKEFIYGTNRKSEVYRIENGKFKQLVATQLPSNYFKAIATPKNDGLILKTDKKLFLFNGEMHPIIHNLTFIRDILFDTEDNLWVATEEGLYNFFQLNFVNFKFNMGNKDWVWSVLEDDNHDFWFASYQNGLWKWDGSRITNYTYELNRQISKHLSRTPKPLQYRYYMGASKYGSTLIFPTEFNVLKYENRNFSPIAGLPELPFQITKAYPDGSLYCGGYPGLYEIRGNKLTKSWHRDRLGVSSVLNLERDKYNNLVVIGKDGLSLIKGDSIQHYKQTDIQNSYSLAKDHRKNIWIGGIQHIHLFDGNSVKFVAARNEEAFYSMLFVRPHYLFLGGIKGLYLVDLNEYYNTGNFEMVLYNQNNGFTGIECGQNGFLTDSEGKVWIPTSDLVTRFHPVKLIEKKISPPRIYMNVSTSPDNISWQNTKPESIQILPYHNNNIRFSVDAVSFSNSGNIRYYYQLSGLQNQWSAANETNEITYYNLKPGSYEFKVKADAGISKATSEVLSIRFSIAKPYWMKWWFILVSILSLSIIIVALIQFFRKREKKQAAIQQRLTQLRSEALAAQLDPHFVMNCLNNISGMINAGLKEEANAYIVKFSRLLRAILRSVKKELISLSSEIEMVTNYLHLEQFRCNNCFTFDIKLPGEHSIQNIMVPPMMLQPLVENSIKHGFGQQKIKDAHILIQIRTQHENLHISICDNGVGLKTQSPSLGTGLGTKITRERIELLQKRRNIEFEILDRNPGTEVLFQIPLVIKTMNG